ncbi:MAG: ribulose-phosphate 3-epimerase, partial [Cytophagales bacterium]|nr:ribulose-phosphate 3-epimerase [Cytophaga sp.]
INSSKADWFHIDIMDVVFVPNISFGFPVLNAINKHATKPLDVHLMIVNPEKYIQTFKDSGAANISVHYEACTHLHRTIYQIKELGCKAGIALNPHTPVHVLKDIIKDIDLVCMMSVNPGFGGQKFIEHTYQKVRDLKQLIQENNANVLIEIDGGVNELTGPELVKAGADVLVAGNFVFSSKDPLGTIEQLKKY